MIPSFFLNLAILIQRDNSIVNYLSNTLHFNFDNYFFLHLQTTSDCSQDFGLLPHDFALLIILLTT